MLAQYIVARQEFYLYGVCVGYRNVWNRTKRLAGNLPEPTGGQTAPASFTQVVPGAQLATESTVESGFEVAARDRDRECSRAGAFDAGSLTHLDRFHHGRVRFMRHADPSAALGSMEPANTKRSGQQTGVPEPVLSSTATWDSWRGRRASYDRPRSGPDRGQTNRSREPGSHPTRLSSGVTGPVRS